MKTKQAVVITMLLSLVLMTNMLFAQAPNLLNYQGKLTGTTSSTVPMMFAFYDVPTGGSSLWSEAWSNVPVTNGVFNVVIGKNSTPIGIPSSVFAGTGDRYLEITVSGTTIGRFQLTSAAFAIRANQADGVADNAITSAKILNATITGADIASSTIGLNNLNFTPVNRPLSPGVSSAEIADNAVSSAKIQDGTITGTDIANGEVVRSINNLKDNVTLTAGSNVIITPSGNTISISATGTQLPDGSVTTAKIQDGAVTGLKIATAAVGTNHLNFAPLTSSSDYGRLGVTSTLYEGSTPLSSKYFSTSGGSISGNVSVNGFVVASSSLTGSNANSNGTGVVGYGNGLSSGSVPSLGSGGSFTGTQFGVAGWTRNASSNAGVIGVGNGLSSFTFRAAGSGGAFTGAQYGVAGYAANTSGERAGGYFNSAGVNAFANVAYVDGNGTVFKIQGAGTVSTVMQTRSGMRALFAPESPEAWFEDIGRGQLINGRARIELDPLFLDVATISPEFPMNVFIQLNDDCHGVFVKSDGTGFNVQELQNGKSNAQFTYKVVVKWKGYENKRFPDVQLPQAADRQAAQ